MAKIPITTFNLEDNVKMPPKSKGRKLYSFPLEDMEVGQSFLIPKSALGALRAVRARLEADGKWWEIRKIDDKSYRCWRTI